MTGVDSASKNVPGGKGDRCLEIWELCRPVTGIGYLFNGSLFSRVTTQGRICVLATGYLSGVTEYLTSRILFE